MGTCFDFTNPQAVVWWQAQIERLVVMGVDGFKTDFGEQVPEDAVFCDGRLGSEMHNRFPQLYNQVTYEAMSRHTHGILLARSAWDDSQSYSAIWAGDQSADFGPATGLPSVIIAGQTAGLSGFPFWASDIGGYFGQPTEEVFARWIAFGAFSPIMQLHGLGCREPWKFSKEILEIYRYYARVHTDLFPYIYTHAKQASESGMPIVRAMPLAFPDDPAIWQPNAEFQYAFGRDLLVAPVYFGHSTSRYVYLPPGLWRDFWSGALHPGDREIIVAAELNQIPVFARAGALIPLLDPSADTLLPVMDEPEIKVAGNHLRLQIYPGADGNFDLYDGTRFRWLDASRTLQVSDQPVDRWISIRMMEPALRFEQVLDANGQQLPTENTNLNGEPNHIRFQTVKNQLYQVIFK
jgi:alpha-D-xyloside xylohydrolase